MRPSKLLPGDVLCYKGTDLLGKLISWGEYTDGHEHTQYTHVALVFDATRLIRQNPGGPAFEDLDAQPWDQIDVFSLNLPIDRTSQKWADSLDQARLKHWTETYGFSEFADYTFEDLEARIGAISDAEKQRDEANKFLDNHQSVCSGFAVQEVLPDAITIYSGDPCNLFPELGPGQVRPADIPLCSELTIETA